MKTAPYGLWDSPFSPAALSQAVRLDDVQWDSDGETLVWLEGRSGRGTLVALRPGQAPADRTGPEINVRGGVGYGGGAFCAQAGQVVFTTADGRLLRLDLSGGSPVVLAQGGAFASPAISPDGRWVAAVHSAGELDRLLVVPAAGGGAPRVLAQGADFYMQPAWRPDSQALAWVEWDHPDMPWDSARLMLADFDPDTGQVGSARHAAGGRDHPVFQPLFSPDGSSLAYLDADAAGDVERLVLLDLASGAERTLRQAVGLFPAAWLQGMRTLAWAPDGRCVYALRSERGFGRLERIPLTGAAPETLDLAGRSWAEQLCAAPGSGRLALIASAPGIPHQVLAQPPGGAWASMRDSLALDQEPAFFSTPQPLEWQAEDGAAVYGLYYPPHQPGWQGRGQPPAILHPHGGPTHQVTAAFDPEVAFYTSRGYGWLGVNYRGSSGHGPAYWRALYGRWGELDAVDTAGAARALAAHRLADPRRLVLEGSSAGGFTLLNCLIRWPDLFCAGVCSYPVTDLVTISAETFKFERWYTSRLAGPLPESLPRYQAYSPLREAGRIRAPLALFHGDADPAVPLAQSQALAETLRRAGVPLHFRVFPGEGHGFRQAEHLRAYYAEVEQFLRLWVARPEEGRG